MPKKVSSLEESMESAVTNETEYTVQELAMAHDKQFRCSYEIVFAALTHAKKDKATLTEAKDIVGKFRKLEVK